MTTPRSAPFLRSLLAVMVAVGLIGLLGCTGDDAPPSDASGPDATASDASASDPSAGAVPDSVNTLTEAEKANGWMLLFDGTSFEHWRAFQADSMADDWVVENGTMHFTGADDDGAPDDIVTQETFGDFDLRVEWKISPAGNSGIMFHVREGDREWPWQTGPEMQVLDNEGHPNGEDPLTSAGANYGLYAPQTDATKPVGQWNEARLVVDDGQVTHYLNGTKLLSYEIGGDEWTERVNNSKFGEMPDYAAFDSGRLALQDHTDPVWFRDIKIRRLDDE